MSEWHVTFIGSASANSVLLNFRQKRNNPFTEFFSFGLKWLVIKLLQLPNSGGEKDTKKDCVATPKRKNG